MSFSSKIASAVYTDPLSTFGHADYGNSLLTFANAKKTNHIKTGTVVQFNVGQYSALVHSEGVNYNCFVGCQNVTPSFGYSDANILREGDDVIFVITEERGSIGMILARRPQLYCIDDVHQKKVTSRTQLERRTHFFKNSQDCYRHEALAYKLPLQNPKDPCRVYTCNRPTDMVPGDFGLLNQHRCGIFGGMYSTTLVGGGSHIRIFSLENRIRIVAENIFKCTFISNENEWHNRRYLSHERAVCLYQEERLGMKAKETKPFDKADYHSEGYFTKNKKERQTARTRILEQEGYYANLSTRYCLRPDPDSPEPRAMDDKPMDPGVMRESVDPSGQYRLAATGMLGFERIGRIPIPFRNKYPWQQEVEEPKAKALEEFKHDEGHPYYRQLELADRVAYDLKNSYARLDEEKNEFHTPEESDLQSKLKDIYDPGFTESKTVKLEKYDRRRSGIWQGEDGSIIIRDAWGSEIVMIGGNIQLSCAGNVETMPGKTAMTIAGDDIVQKAQNSIDIESADKDVRVNAFKNVQIMAGADDDNPGGITIEAKGKAGAWDAKAPDGGEQVSTRGILIKSKEGSIVTDTKNMVLRARKLLSLVSGTEDIDGQIFTSAKGIYTRGENIITTTEEAALILTGAACLVGESAILAGKEGAGVFQETKFHVPLMLADIGKNIANEIMSSMQKLIEVLKDETIVALGYRIEDLDKMFFKFRSTKECGTDASWELQGTGDFTLYEPFWVQVKPKFETLEGVSTKEFEDHKDMWGGDIGHPWPGTDAVGSGKYAQLSSLSPENIDNEGFNKSRQEVVDHSTVVEKPIFPGYQIRN